MLNTIFQVKKPIIGMVHADDLSSSEGMDGVAKKALENARRLYLEGRGVDGLLVENWEEHSQTVFVTEETVRKMLRITKLIREAIPLPVGVNILHNDYRAAFRIAKALKLPFVQLDVFSDKVRTEFSHTQGVQFDVSVDIPDVQKRRRGTGAALFVNIHPKHYTLLEEGKTIEESAKQAIDNGADGVVITKLTGTAPDTEFLERVKNFTEKYKKGFPVIVGSGVGEENVKELLLYGDGAIVGTALKIDGITEHPVDPERVENFMTTVRAAFR